MLSGGPVTVVDTLVGISLLLACGKSSVTLIGDPARCPPGRRHSQCCCKRRAGQRPFPRRQFEVVCEFSIVALQFPDGRENAQARLPDMCPIEGVLGRRNPKAPRRTPTTGTGEDRPTKTRR